MTTRPTSHRKRSTSHSLVSLSLGPGNDVDSDEQTIAPSLGTPRRLRSSSLSALADATRAESTTDRYAAGEASPAKYSNSKLRTVAESDSPRPELDPFDLFGMSSTTTTSQAKIVSPLSTSPSCRFQTADRFHSLSMIGTSATFLQHLIDAQRLESVEGAKACKENKAEKNEV
ncbi:hypothetical protein RQP46_010880 [Phenoliferia psychrophenolica]